MHDELKIIFYPDPRLKKVSETVQHFDENLRSLSRRMLELMREAKGVGLAAPQVGQNIRLFVMNATGKPEDDTIYVNPVLTEGEGETEEEEGCLSLPNINVDVFRAKSIRIDAQNLLGENFNQTASGYLARIWQHEFDHLNGILLTDRMGPVAKLSNRRTLRDLEDRYKKNKGK